MKLISQLNNYWNKLRYKKYKAGTSIDFIHYIHSIPNRTKGIVENVCEHSRFPITVKLNEPLEIDGLRTSYVNIKLNQIICKN